MDLEGPISVEYQVSPTMEQIKDSLLLKVIFLLNLLINLIGGTMHFALVFVTIRNKKFHSTCHLLIGANSLCTISAYFAVFLPLFVFFLPTLRPTLFHCFAVQFIPLFANFHIFALILAIGFDRLLCTFWPIWYSSRNDRFYLLLLLFTSSLFPFCIVWIAFLNMISKPNVERACTLGELLGSRSASVSLFCLSCMAVSVCFYSAVWVRLKFEKKGQFEGKARRPRQQAIFRSLCIILCLQLGGWTLGQLIYAVVYTNQRRINPLDRWLINSAVLVFLSLTAALDVPVLYHTSVDYKAALSQMCRWREKGPNKEIRGKEAKIISN